MSCCQDRISEGDHRPVDGGGWWLLRGVGKDLVARRIATAGGGGAAVGGGADCGDAGVQVFEEA